MNPNAIEIANAASEKLCDAAEWLYDELEAALGKDHALIPLAEHVVAEAWRTAVACALAKAEHG